MNKNLKIKSMLAILGIFVLIFVLFNILPFLYLWAGLSAKDYQTQVKLQKGAVQMSVFNFQKVYTRNSVLPILVLTGDYNTAVEYFEDLEELDSIDTLNTKLAIFSYIKIGEFHKALSYAILVKDDSRVAQIYLKLKDYQKANFVVNELLKKKPPNISTYEYKAELLLEENKLKDADMYVDKALEISPTYINALYLKSRICKRLNKSEDSKKYLAKAQYYDNMKKDLSK